MSISVFYIVTDAQGNLIDWSDRIAGLSVLGQEARVLGSGGDDSVYVQAGSSANLSELGSGNDRIYLTGHLGDYSQSLDDAGIYTFTRTLGLSAGQSEVVRLSYSGEDDRIFFADGHVLLNEATVADADGLPTLLTASMLQSGGTPAGGPDGSDGASAIGQSTTHAAPLRVIVQKATGIDLPQAAQVGQHLVVQGSGGDDSVYVRVGTSIDASGLGSGNDRVYLTGPLADYSQSIDAAGVYTLTRTTGLPLGVSEVVRFAFADEADEIYFADGHIVLDSSTAGLFDADTGLAQTLTSAMFVQGGAGTPGLAASIAISGISDDVSPVTGHVTSGFSNDATPTLEGTLSATLDLANSECVQVLDAGTLIGTASVNDKAWSLTIATPLSDGSSHSFVAQVVDALGQTTRPASAAYVLQIDTTPPTLSIHLVAGDNQVNLTEKNAGVTVSGLSDADEVSLHWGTVSHTAKVSAGSWSSHFTSSDIPNVDGPTTLSAQGTDLAGNTTTVTQAVAVYAVAATVTSISLSTTGAMNQSLNEGDVVTVSVEFSQVVIVETPLLSDGITRAKPQLALNVGGASRYAVYASGSNSQTLCFSYTIHSGDTDTDGLSIDAHSIQLNGGRIDGNGGNPATLTHDAVSITHPLKVDTTPPTLSLDAVAGDNAINAAERAQDLTLTGLTSAEDAQTVTVVWGGRTHTGAVSHPAGSGTGLWSVRFPHDDMPTAQGSSTLSVDVSDLAGNAATPVTRVVILDTAAPDLDGTLSLTTSVSTNLKAGETAILHIALHEDVSHFSGLPGPGSTVSGIFQVGQVPKIATWGAHGQELTLSYTVQAGDNGVITVDTALLQASLGSGLSDLAGNHATLAGSAWNAATFSAVPSPSQRVDTTAPSLLITCSQSSFKMGDTATVTLSFSESVTGFDAQDIHISGGGLSGWTGSGATYYAIFTPADHLNLTSASMTVASGSYTDAAGNPGGAGASPSLTVDTHVPSFTSALTVSLYENTPSGTFYDISASDTGTITYSLKPNAGDNAMFTLSSMVGEPCHVINQFTPDYESQSTYSFTVVATNAVGNSSEQTVTLFILNVDEPTSLTDSARTITPVLINLHHDYTQGLADNFWDPENGTLNYVLSGSLPHGLSLDTRSGLITGTPDTTGQSTFTITADDGVDNGQDARLVYSLTVVDGVNVAISPVSGDDCINWIEHYSPITVSGTTTHVQDGWNVNVVWGTSTHVAVVSADTWETVFSMAEWPGEGIGTLSAEVSHAVGDPSNPARRSVLIDTVNPAFTSLNFAGMLENSGSHQVVYRAQASDASPGLVYSLVWFDGGNADSTLLSIDSATGAVSLSPNPDFETQSEYDFTVKALDLAGNASYLGVTLYIINLDEPTVLAQGVTGAYSSQVTLNYPYTLGVAHDFSDPDAGAMLTYRLSSGSLPSGLSLNSHTGVLSGTPLSTGVSTFTLTADDGVNNGQDARRVYSLTVNTVPFLAIDTIAGDDEVNAAEKAGGITVSGTTSVEDMQVVTVHWGTASASASVHSGTWASTFSGSQLPGDGTFNVTADVSNVDGLAAEQAMRSVIIDASSPLIGNRPTSMSTLTQGAQLDLANLSFSKTGDSSSRLKLSIVANGGILGGLIDEDGSTPGVQISGTGSELSRIFAAATFTPGLAGGTATVDLTLTDPVGNPSVYHYLSGTITARLVQGLPISADQRAFQSVNSDTLEWWLPSSLNIADASAALYSGNTLVKGGTLSASSTVSAVKVLGPDNTVRNLGIHPSFEPAFPDTLYLDTGPRVYSSALRESGTFTQLSSASAQALPDFTGFTHLGANLVPDTSQPIYRAFIYGTAWYVWQPQGWLGRYILSTISASTDWWIGGNSSGLGTGNYYREGVLHAGHWFYNHGSLNSWDSALQNYWGLFSLTGIGTATDWTLSLGQGNDVQPGDHLQIVSTVGGVQTLTHLDLPADITRPTLGTATLSASDAAGHALSPDHVLGVGDVVHVTVPASEPLALLSPSLITDKLAQPWPGVDNAVIGLDIGGVTRWAALNRVASAQGQADQLVFDYTIANGDVDTSGGLHVGALDNRFTRMADQAGNRLWTQMSDLAETPNTWQVQGSSSALTDQPSFVLALVPGMHWPDRTPNGIHGDAVTTLTYAYLTDWPTYYQNGVILPDTGSWDSTSANTDFVPWTSAMMGLLDHMLMALSTYAKIDFTLVSDASQANLAMASYAMADYIGGYGYYPASDSSVQVGNEYGDFWLNSTANLQSTWTRFAIAHELGHTLGLKHPGNYNAGGGGTDGPYLDNTSDNYRFTVMSYNDVSGLQYPNDYMLYDIASLQYLYGARDYNTGDTAISIGYPTSGAAWDATDMIYDTGGIDTLSVSGARTGVTLDLVQGEFCSIGGTQNFGICFGTVIENAVGTSFADTLIGNTANNTFTGGGGADTFVFGPEWGQDTITDFDPSQDHLSFARDATITRESLSIVSAGGSTIILHGNDSLSLPGVANLPASAITYVI